MNLKNFIRKTLSPHLYEKAKNYWQQILCRKSIEYALREQKLSELAHRLAEIVPDIKHQYSTFKLDTKYLITNVRAQHAFQIFLVQKALRLLGENADNDITIVDIGDSAGTHILYIKRLFGKGNIRTLSVNLDEEAVKRIKGKGLDAICAKAEELTEKYSINADIFLSFEILEHLMSPAEFLYKLSTKTNCKLFVVTVPYLKSSRVGLHHMRNLSKTMATAENTHIFELSPESWRLLFQFAGWRVIFEKIYLQYPKRHWLWIMKPYWKKFDFEGFYGAILVRDHIWCNFYKDW